jgi:hypothetical protein
MASPNSVLIALPDQDEVPVQTHARDINNKSTMRSPDSVLIALPDQDEVPAVQTHARDINYKNTIRSPDLVLESAMPNQNEVSAAGKALELGSRYDKDEDDCSCRTDMTTLRASNGQRCATVRNQDMRVPSVGCI